MRRSRCTREVGYRDSDAWPGQFKVGTWAFVLHRISGLALVLFVFIHLAAMASALGGQDAFDRTMAFLHRPVFRPLEVALLAALLFHGLNGLRIILLDLGVGFRYQKHMFWAAFALAAAGTLTGAWYLLAPLIGGMGR